MAQQIGQLTYNLFNPTADPGQLAEFDGGQSITSFNAGDTTSNVNPGRFVELCSDNLSCQQPQQTSSTFKPLGVALLKRYREGTGAVGVTGYGVGGVSYVFGEPVPVLMKGRVFAEWDATSTQQAFTIPNVKHSSTITTDRGKVTFAATSTTAGSEISVAPSAVKTRQLFPNTGSIVLLDVNLPGA